jgi:chromosome segregation ATPase
MQSIKYLEEQVETYKRYVKDAEQDRDEAKAALNKAQYEYESFKGKLEGLEYILKMVKQDFQQYGWNPAG